MAESYDDLIWRIRAVGITETEAQVAGLRKEIGALGTTAKSSTERASAGFGMLGRGMRGVAVALGVSGIITGFKDTIKAGIDLQRQLANLQASLDGIGLHSKEAMASADEFAIHLSQHGGFVRPEEISSLAQYINQLRDYKEAQQAATATVMLARAFPTMGGFHGAQMALSRALGGNVTRLQQYVGYIPKVKDAQANLTTQHNMMLQQMREQEQQQIQAVKDQYIGMRGPMAAYYRQQEQQQERDIRNREKLQEIQQRNRWATGQDMSAVDKQKQAHQILNYITSKFQPNLDAYNNSMSGHLNNLKNSFEILKGQIGMKLLPIVKLAVDAFKKFFDFLSSHRGLLTAFVVLLGVAGLGGALGLVFKGVMAVEGALRGYFSKIAQFILGQTEADKAAEAHANQERALAMAMARVSAEEPAMYEALQGMSMAELEAAASAQKFNDAIMENMALASRWKTSLAESEGSLAATAGAESGIMARVGGSMAGGPWVTALMIIATVVLPLVLEHWKEIWKTMKSVAEDVWKWIKKNWPLLVGIILLPFVGPIGIIVALFHNQLWSAIKSVWAWIEGAAPRVWHALSFPFVRLWSTVKSVFKSVVGAVQSAWHWIEGAATRVWNALTWPFRKAWDFIKGVANGIKNVFGSIIHTAGSIMSTLSFGFLSGGGPVHPKYLAGGGGPFGTDVIPGWLTPGEGVVTKTGMKLLGSQGLDMINRGRIPATVAATESGGGQAYLPLQVQLRVDGRVLAEAVTNAVLRKAARGPTSLVGGSLVTGSGVINPTAGATGAVLAA